MIKKIFAIFLSLFCATSAFADSEKEVFIYPDVLEYVLEDAFQVREQEKSAFAQAFNQHLTETGMINQSGLQAACNAAGWNSALCGRVVDILLTRFYSVCDKSVSVKSGECVQLFNSAMVRIPEGIALAKEYLLKKHRIKAVCSSDIRGKRYLKCSSVDNYYKFEFNFGNLTTTEDNSILHSVLNAVGKIHGVQTLTGISDISAITKDGDDGFAAYNVSDYKKCSEINNTLQKMGYESKIVKNSKAKQNYTDWVSAKYGLGFQARSLLKQQNLPHPDDVSDNLCTVSGIVRTTDELRTAYGIDNYIFYKQQLTIYMELTEQIKQYVNLTLKKQSVPLQSFSCDSSTGHVKLSSGRDEVLTCYVNGKPVDFVFDDLSEFRESRNNAARQFINCTVAGGMFNGEGCEFVHELGCTQLQNQNAKNCPTCKEIKWDPDRELCILPDAKAAEKTERNLAYVYIVGGAVTAVAVTVMSGGTGAALVLGYLATATELAGATMEIVAQVQLDKMAQVFLDNARTCKNQTCAINIINNNLQTLSNIIDDMSDNEIRTIDQMFEELFGYIDENTDEGFNFWKIFLENFNTAGDNGSLLEANKKGYLEKGSWEPAQVWRAVGLALQLIPAAVTAVGTKFLKKSKQLGKATQKIITKMDDLSRNSDFVRKLQDTTSGPLAAALRDYADAQNTTLTLLDVASSAGELNTGSVNTVKDATDVVRKILK